MTSAGRRIAAILAATVCLASSFARAEVRGILVWQPEAGGPKLVVPDIRGVEPKAFVQNYVSALNADAGYLALNAGNRVTLPAERISVLQGGLSTNGEEFLVIANRPGHMLKDDLFLHSVLGSLTRAGATPVIVPVGLENVLDASDLSQFHEKLVARFHALLSIGGGDIHPGIYGQEITYARAVNRKRDDVETALIRLFNQREQGMFYGICRGAQLGAATLGFELIQDVPLQMPDAGEHAVGSEGAQDAAHISAWHEVEIVPGSFLALAVGATRMQVNSRHHQAVVPADSSRARITARAPDGTVETIEFTNGRGVLFQFHPEDMGTEEAQLILAAMVTRARELRLASEAAPSCAQLLKIR